MRRARPMLGFLGDVPTGGFVKYTGSWTTTPTKGASDIINEVSSALSSDGLPVVQVSSDAGAKAFILGAFGVSFNVTLVLQVTGPGFGSAGDAASIVNHEVYQATGMMPTTSAAISSGTGPGGGASDVPPPQGPEDWQQWIQDNALWIGAGIFAAVVLPKLL